MVENDNISIDEENYDEKIKIMLLGDSSVGKTSIIKRYCKNQYSNSFISTIGVDFETKYINIDGKIINIQIWDTAGQERYKILAQSYYKNSDGFVIVYDITSRISYDNIHKWIEQIKEYASEKIKNIIVANKCDLENKRQISKEEGKELAEKYNFKFYETSALNGKNIDKAFDNLAKMIIDSGNLSSSTTRSASMLSKECHKNNKGKKKCC